MANPTELEGAEITLHEISHTSSAGCDEDVIEYIRPLLFVLILLALCFSVFLVALDEKIVTTAVPKITDRFKALEDVGWYGSSYLLSMSAFQLVFGKIYAYFSLKLTYIAAIAIFELGSLLCGIAFSSKVLIIGRAIAGIGGAGIMCGSLIILANVVPLRRRALYSGLIGAMFAVASVIGPLLGGAFTDSRLTWRWCFYINLPIGVIASVVTAMCFKSPKGGSEDSLTFKDKLKKIDFLGFTFFVSAILCLLLALEWGGTQYSWSDGRMIALFVSAALSIVFLAVTQALKGDNAGLPPQVLKNRSITCGALFMFLLSGAFFVLIFYLPIWFQAIKGVSAMKSGIMNLALLLAIITMSISSGAAVSIIGYYVPFMIASSIFMAIGSGLLTTLRTDSGHPMWIGYQALAGFGVGMGILQSNMAAQTVLHLDDVPVGTGVMMFSQSVGGGLFVAIAQTAFKNSLISGLRSSVPELPNAAELVLNVGATALNTVIKEIDDGKLVDRVLATYNHAIMQTFRIATVMGAVALLPAMGMEWVSMTNRRNAPVKLLGN